MCTCFPLFVKNSTHRIVWLAYLIITLKNAIFVEARSASHMRQKVYMLPLAVNGSNVMLWLAKCLCGARGSTFPHPLYSSLTGLQSSIAGVSS